MSAEPQDLGHGVRITWARAYGNDKIVGLIEEHDRPDGGGRCEGFVRLKVDEEWPDSVTWDVLSWEPLTLSPSLLCRICGNHGWIREGRWIPC